MPAVRAWVVLAAITVSMTLVSCGGDGTGIHRAVVDGGVTDAPGGINGAHPTSGHSSSGFTLVILPGSFLGQDPAGTFSLCESAEAGEVVVTVSVEDAENLRAVYGRLAYDPMQYTPVAVEQLPLVADDTVEQLALSSTSEPGIIDFGQVLANCADRNGLSGAADVAVVRFKEGAFSGATRSANAVPVADDEAPELTINISDRSLSWPYILQGDYNQDGLVGLSDLTPFGIHYGEEADDWRGFDEGTIQWVIDRNEDGQISIHDITTIGQNYGKEIQAFLIYGSDNWGYEYPSTNVQPGKIPPVGAIPISQAKGEPTAGQLGFIVEGLSLVDGHDYWIRPMGGDEEGTPSARATYDLTSAQDMAVTIFDETYLFDGNLGSVWLDITDNGQLMVDVHIEGASNLRYFACGISYNQDKYCAAGGLGYDELDPENDQGPTQTGPMYWDGYIRCVSHSFSDEHPQVGTEDIHIARLNFDHKPETLDILNQDPTRLDWTSTDFEYDPGAGLLRWKHCLWPDNNQDGTINVLDLYPMGIFYSTPEVFQEKMGFWLLGVGGLNSIGRAYYNTVTGYAIYYSENPDSYEVLDEDHDMSLVTGAHLLAYIPFKNRLKEELYTRALFEYPLPDPQPGLCYWVVPRIGSPYTMVPYDGIIQIPTE